MIQKIRTSAKVAVNMGLRYTAFRLLFEIKRKTGILKKQFPIIPINKTHITLDDWRKENIEFFFGSKGYLSFDRNPNLSLKEEAEKILNGKIPFFSSVFYDLGKQYNWVTNPDNGYEYSINKHWTEIPDYSSDSGDIKYVWEKSRFSFLYTIIRYDYNFDKDCSKFVFDEIKDWIDSNPLNMGPNYRCSQEISLRLLNWTFALFYYRNSSNLTEDIFNKIINSIYNQAIHVRDNIKFSLIAVKNNHAITETLCLFLIGLLYPFFDISAAIKTKGKKLFENEILTQIFDDGSYLQYSMNYHRVVVQLLTWAFYLAEKNNESFSDEVYKKGYLSLKYLYSCQDKISGELPNYGANDGALFFKFNNLDYRNYSPQLNALHYFFFNKNLYDEAEVCEDVLWYNPGSRRNKIKEYKPVKPKPLYSSFNSGGYYIINEPGIKTFIRCGSHKFRPSQADNLHLDIWYNGRNVLRDGGSFKYNTTEEYKKFFYGTSSHNTVMLDNYDQMLKGPRFIWLGWTEAINAYLSETEEAYIFEGSIKTFRHVSKNIIHSRKVIKKKEEPLWIIEDRLINKPSGILNQIWNLPLDNNVLITATDIKGRTIKPEIKNSLYSGKYGEIEESRQIVISSVEDIIKTEIRIIAK